MEKGNHLKIIIIGGGLTGLTIAYLLKKRGLQPVIVEARDRLGGRIFTKYLQDGVSIEMGATWLGKKHNHLIHLTKTLGLEIFEQEMGKYAIYEAMSTSPPQVIQLPPNPQPTYRIKGGSSALIQALVAQLESDQIQWSQVVRAIYFRDDKVEVETDHGHFEADQVISTLPPKLLVDSIHFSPSLPKALVSVAERTHTWMGDSIKVGLSFPRPFWREQNRSGTIFSNVGPITEMYDHSTHDQSGFAIKGFMHSAFQGITKEERKQRVIDQLTKYYGTEIRHHLHYEDAAWSTEPFTFAPYEGTVFPHQHNGNPIFRAPLFDGRFWVAGSETAEAYPGYMDGAVQSARWVVDQLL